MRMRSGITLAEIAMSLVVIAIVLAAVMAGFSAANERKKIIDAVNGWNELEMKAVQYAAGVVDISGVMQKSYESGSNIVAHVQGDQYTVRAERMPVALCTYVQDNPRHNLIRFEVATAYNTYTQNFKCSESTYLANDGLFFRAYYRR